MPVNKQFLTTLRAGDIIVYLARPEDLPVHPDKQWRGKVLHIYLDQPPLLDHVHIESLSKFSAKSANNPMNH